MRVRNRNDLIALTRGGDINKSKFGCSALGCAKLSSVLDSYSLAGRLREIGPQNISKYKQTIHSMVRSLFSLVTQANRAAFIESVRDYMDEYGFTGIDIDWEYPGEPKRGGRKLDDTRAFATLFKEMRAAYGDKYGISLTLAPDYWYLRWFDAKAMEPYVDFFGFMAYGKLASVSSGYSLASLCGTIGFGTL
jgi:hypothetical protein